jgi:hypothetical protein
MNYAGAASALVIPMTDLFVSVFVYIGVVYRVPVSNFSTG